MKYFSFVTLASTALAASSVLADNENAQDTDTTYTGSSKPVNCLNAFNEARVAAGLVPFVSAGNELRVTFKKEAEEDEEKAKQEKGAESGEGEPTEEEFNSDVCKALMTQQPMTEIADLNSTVALAVQNGNTGDCAAAVTHFNGALSLFGSLPPAYAKDEPVYKNLQAVSFVALYNPKENPKLDCGYFTCTATTKAALQTHGDDVDNTSQGNTTTLNALLCGTTPKALVAGKAPFEQKLYDKIKGAINSSFTAVPALITLAVAAGGMLFF